MGETIGPCRYVSGRDWALYFCHIRMIEPDTMMIDDGTSVNPDGVIIGKPNYGLRLFHVNGCLFKIVPTKDFWGWSPGLMMTVPLEGANWQVKHLPRKILTNFSKAEPVSNLLSPPISVSKLII